QRGAQPRLGRPRLALADGSAARTSGGRDPCRPETHRGSGETRGRHRLKSITVEWVERSEAHQVARRRWVSLRSTHSTNGRNKRWMARAWNWIVSKACGLSILRNSRRGLPAQKRSLGSAPKWSRSRTRRQAIPAA